MIHYTFIVHQILLVNDFSSIMFAFVLRFKISDIKKNKFLITKRDK